METINKQVSLGKWKLEYSQFFDNGIKKDMFDLKYNHHEDYYTCFPVMPMFIVKDWLPDKNLADCTNEPSEEEMLEMLKKESKSVEAMYDLSEYPAKYIETCEQ